MHACVTYSGMGSWFFMKKMNQDVASTLAFMLILSPLTWIIRESAGKGVEWAAFFLTYRDFVGTGRFLEASGPLWFAVALLVFSILFAVMRLVADALRGPASKRPASAPRVLTGRAISIGAVCPCGWPCRDSAGRSRARDTCPTAA